MEHWGCVWMPEMTSALAARKKLLRNRKEACVAGVTCVRGGGREAEHAGPVGLGWGLDLHQRSDVVLVWLPCGEWISKNGRREARLEAIALVWTKSGGDLDLGGQQWR